MKAILLRNTQQRQNAFVTLKTNTNEGFCSRSTLQAHFARVSTPVKNRGAFSGVEILLPRMKYAHEIFGTHGGALLPERAPGACSGRKIPRLYRP